MTYTGNVSVGGPAQTRELPGLTITKVAVGPMDNNAYLLRCTSTGELLLIDAANEPETLLGLIGDIPLATIVTTHRHGDHWQALEPLAKATGAETVAHVEDAPALPVAPSELVSHGDTHSRRRRQAVRHPPARAHAGQHRPAVRRGRRAGRRAAPVHRRLAVPRRSRQHRPRRGQVQLADHRSRGADLRQAARWHLGLPRPRRRHHHRRGAPACARVARPRLVTASRPGSAAVTAASRARGVRRRRRRHHRPVSGLGAGPPRAGGRAAGSGRDRPSRRRVARFLPDLPARL